MSRSAQRPTSRTLPALASALVVPASLGAATGLGSAGLAWIVVMALTGALVGGWFSRLEAEEADSPLPAPLRALGELAPPLAVGATLAPLVADLTSYLVLVAALAASIIAGRRWPVTATSVALVGAIAVLAGSTAWASAVAPPWTLLQPRWVQPMAWVPGALLAGWLISSAWSGPWAGWGASPAHRRRPWVVVAAMVVITSLAAVRSASTYEALDNDDATLVKATLGLAAMVGVVAAPSPALGSSGRSLALALASLWLAGPGQAAVPLVWGWILPMTWAALCVGLGWRRRGLEGLGAGALGLLVAGITLAAAPAIPQSPGEAVIWGLTVVGLLWGLAAPGGADR